MDIGIVGVGTMGSQMLRRLLAAGHHVSFVDIDPHRQREATQLGGRLVAKPSELGMQSDVVLMSLPGPADVRAVVAGEDGLLTPEQPRVSVIVDLSTVDPSTSVEMAAHAARRSVGYVDSPVLGRPAGCGQWTLPVGGAAADLASVQPVLSSLAARVVSVGAVGSGNTVKLLNNLMFGAINGVVVECMAAAPRLGVDPGLFYDVISKSNAASVSNLFLDIGPRIVDRDFSPAFRLSLLDKDVRLGVELLSGIGIDPLIGTAVAKLIERSHALTIGDLDTSALVTVYEADDAAR